MGGLANNRGMSSDAMRAQGPLFLGIEGGGTRTVALLADGRGKLVRCFEAGPANVRLLTDGELKELFQSIVAECPGAAAVVVGLAGARSEQDRRRIVAAAGEVWPDIPCYATNDLETALAADGEAADGEAARVLVLSGTGSCCYGQNTAGRSAKVGGWGHLLGDQGSGYEIGLRALKISASQFDWLGKWLGLGSRLTRRLGIRTPDELISWAQSAAKGEIAALATEVFRSAGIGDGVAAGILADARESLARDAIACARQLASRGKRVRFVLAGGILVRQPGFARGLGARLRKQWPGAVVSTLWREGAWGAAELARKVWESQSANAKAAKPVGGVVERKMHAPATDELLSWAKLAATERRNPRSANLDRLPVTEAVELMVSEDAGIPAAIRRQLKEIEQAVNLIARAFKRGGRLFYVGAGTSGRLGVLDASECPPTFRTPPEMVQGIIAGGNRALVRSVEGAEDNAVVGARAMAARKIGRRDVVTGITASGRTPFVWGALSEARRRGARTILICFNPFQKMPGQFRPEVVIAPEVGPEILTGSTRLKAGTATKMILNMLTTLAMVRIGKVAGNLMADLNPSNVKLRDRAVRIVSELCGVNGSTARTALERTGWRVKVARAKLDRQARTRK